MSEMIRKPCPKCLNPDNEVLRFRRGAKRTRTTYKCTYCKHVFAESVPNQYQPKGEIK